MKVADPLPDPSSSPFAPSFPASRPRVVIEDASPSPEQKNPLSPYFIGACVLAGALLIGLIVSFLYQNGKYGDLEAQYQDANAQLEQKNAAMGELQGQLAATQQELNLFRGDQANLALAVTSARQNVSAASGELMQCKNALVLAQGEIKRLQGLEATKCNTLLNELKGDCNLAIDKLFTNTTTACKIAVDDSPNATGDEVKKDVEKKVKLTAFKFSVSS